MPSKKEELIMAVLFLANKLLHSNTEISQNDLPGSSKDHEGTGACDYIHDDPAKRTVRAPGVRMKLLWLPEDPEINKRTSLVATNTFILESESEVMFADGTTGILSMSLGHMSDTDYATLKRNYKANHTTDLANGSYFDAGEIMYYFGAKGGGSTGVHVHMRIGKGKFLSSTVLWRETSAGSNVWMLNTSVHPGLKHDSAFYIDDFSFKTNGYYSEIIKKMNFKTYDPVTPPTESDLYLVAKTTGFRVRESVVNGAEKAMVTKGNKAKIISFVGGFQTDGYQWAKVDYNGAIGYSQMDTKAYMVQRIGSTPNTYLRALATSFRVRSTPVNGTELAMIYPVNQVTVLDFVESYQSDGYQWIKVRTSSGIEGYSQLDTKAYNLTL